VNYTAEAAIRCCRDGTLRSMLTWQKLRRFLADCRFHGMNPAARIVLVLDDVESG
jgi:hypothetical protein